MAILFDSWSVICALHPDLLDASSLTEHAFAGDQHLRSFDNTPFAVLLLTLRTQLQEVQIIR